MFAAGESMERPAILIVDDRKENLLVLERLLGETGAVVIKAKNGNDALKACLNREFALALLDVNMPEMDGYELAELMRGEKSHSAVPIIFLTAAYRQEEQIFKGYSAGAVDYLIKPLRPEILLNKVKVFLDIYRQRQEIAKLNATLAARSEELEAFSSSVSHDLRAPLRAIDGFSQALLEDYADLLDAQGQDYLQRIHCATQKMAQLIDDLLKFSRLTRRELNLAQIDLSALALWVAAELEESQPNRRVTFRIGPGHIDSGDPNLLKVVIENLLGNAWKFTGNKKEATIEFGASEADGKTVYFVRDNGAGFDMTHADKLFGIFQRLHLEKEFPGIGIGLSLVKRIIHRHGGRVWAESEKGEGATFYFTLKGEKGQVSGA
jgi:signal transduction histidine kinase